MPQLIQPLEVIQGGTARPSPADIRLDKTLVSPHIQVAEFRWVKDAIGGSFYNALIAEKGDSSAFTTPAYQTLWDTNLKALCANATIYESVTYIGMQLGTNGLYLNNNEYGENAGVNGVKFYQDSMRQRIMVQQQMTKDWLCTSATALPDFIPSAVGCPDCYCIDDEFYNDFGLVL